MADAGIDGFLGSRASLAIDLVALAMVAVLPILGWSIYQVRYGGRYRLHKRVQLMLGAVLLVAVGAFEVDIRQHGWEHRISSMPGEPVPVVVRAALAIHLIFAVSSVVLWPLVIVRALRRFPNPPGPGEHSRSHMLWARLAALDMVLTAATGWVFYYLAFVM
jgi:uncharacterized membrane protein YozB (DUF420 family)